MGDVTIGQIIIVLAQTAGVIVSTGTIVGVVIKVSSWIKQKIKQKINEKELKPILDEIKKINDKVEIVNQNVSNVRDEMSQKMEENYKQINQKIDAIEISQCKDAIVDFISDVKAGRNILSKEARAYEAYDKYVNEYHQNSYIHKLWEENVNTEKE
jgi:peptidoglycan hydrolase CwlO-like protein